MGSVFRFGSFRADGNLSRLVLFGLLLSRCDCSPARPTGGSKKGGSGSPQSNVFYIFPLLVLTVMSSGPNDQLDVSHDTIVLSSDSEPEVTEVGRVTNVEIVGSRQQSAAESSAYRAHMQDRVWKDSVSFVFSETGAFLLFCHAGPRKRTPSAEEVCPSSLLQQLYLRQDMRL